MTLILYKKLTGGIITLIFAPEDHKQFYESEENSILISDVVTAENFKNYYIVNEELVLKEQQLTEIDKLTITADGIDVVSITNAPTGIFTATNSETISGSISGSDTFATTIAGTYKITITSFPYLDFTATIEAI